MAIIANVLYSLIIFAFCNIVITQIHPNIFFRQCLQQESFHHKLYVGLRCRPSMPSKVLRAYSYQVNMGRAHRKLHNPVFALSCSPFAF